jgi:cytochrome b561
MSTTAAGYLQGYDAGAKFFHWLTVALLLAQYAVGWIMPDIKRGMQPENLMNLHMSLGMVTMAVVILRIFWRLAHAAPEPEPSLRQWQRVSASAVHWLLYLLVFAMVLTGWSFASMRGWTIVVFGLMRLPALFPQGSAIGHDIGELHETVAWALLVLIGLHVLAALVHQLLFRDRVMRRMLPGSFRR